MPSMQENEKIHISPMKEGIFSFLKIVDKFVCIMLCTALLNYIYFVTLQIVRNLVFNTLFVGIANSIKHTKGAVSAPFFILYFLVNVNIV